MNMVGLQPRSIIIYNTKNVFVCNNLQEYNSKLLQKIYNRLTEK